MLKRLKLKSLLPSSALRSNSAALRLSKTPPQGGVFVSDASHFPGGGSRLTRATNTRRHHSGQPTPNTALTRSPAKRSATGEQTVPVPQPPGHHSGQPTQTPALTRSPAKRSATGEQTVPVPQPPGHHSGQPTPNTALTRSPGKRSATGEQTVPVPQPATASRASLRATNPNTALTRSPAKHSATGEQTVPVP